MYLICIPNINHDYINIISDNYNINIDKKYAIFIKNYYFYKVDRNLTSAASYLVKKYNGDSIIISNNISVYNYNQMSIYNNNYYDNGIAKVYHDNDDVIVMVENRIIEFTIEDFF